MTTINWERHPGEIVEEFVEALILTTVNPPRGAHYALSW
jgi:hypothetical protein